MWGLEVEADIREASPWKSARSMLTNTLEVHHTHLGGGTRHQQKGGQPRREERHGMAAVIAERTNSFG
jgi:hypothetical protein